MTVYVTSLSRRFSCQELSLIRMRSMCFISIKMSSPVTNWDTSQSCSILALHLCHHCSLADRTRPPSRYFGKSFSHFLSFFCSLQRLYCRGKVHNKCWGTRDGHWGLDSRFVRARELQNPKEAVSALPTCLFVRTFTSHFPLTPQRISLHDTQNPWTQIGSNNYIF